MTQIAFKLYSTLQDVCQVMEKAVEEGINAAPSLNKAQSNELNRVIAGFRQQRQNIQELNKKLCGEEASQTKL